MLASAVAVVAILCSIRIVFCVMSPAVLSSAWSVRDNGTLLLLALPFFLSARYYAEIRKDVTATLAILVPVFFILGAVSLKEAQYIIFHVGHKFRLIDADLAAWDAALGFDWPAYFAWVVSRPTVNGLLDVAYHSIWWQPLVLLAVFTVKKRLQDYAALQIALPLSFVATCIIAMVLPALGAYQFHGMTRDRHPGITLEFTDGMTAPILWLRQTELPSAMPTFPDLRVITFPSFHAASAVIFILSAWPLRRLRWVYLLLNGLMLAATPV
jgi:hypothetical protein